MFDTIENWLCRFCGALLLLGGLAVLFWPGFIGLSIIENADSGENNLVWWLVMLDIWALASGLLGAAMLGWGWGKTARILSGICAILFIVLLFLNPQTLQYLTDAWPQQFGRIWAFALMPSIEFFAILAVLSDGDLPWRFRRRSA